MADVLRREENSSAERAQETARGDEAGDREHLDPRRLAHLLVDLDELRNEALVEVELRGALPPLGDGVRAVERRKVLPHRAPDAVLGVRVVDERRRIAGAVLQREPRDLVAAPAVDRIAEAGVVGVELDELVFTPRMRGDGFGGWIGGHRPAIVPSPKRGQTPFSEKPMWQVET
jgi:hypothetical protein